MKKIIFSLFVQLVGISCLAQIGVSHPVVNTKLSFIFDSTLVSVGVHLDDVDKMLKNWDSSKFPDLVNFHKNEGYANVYFSFQDYQTALSYIDKAIILCMDKEDAFSEIHLERAYLMRGHILANSGDREEAVMMYRLAKDITESSEALTAVGNIFEYLGENEEARKQYLEAIKTEPKDDYAYYCISSLELKLQNYHKSMEYINKAINLDPEYGIYYDHRAFIKNILNDYYGAMNDANKALKINPWDGIANSVLGQTYFFLEKYSEAKHQCDLSIMNSRGKIPAPFLTRGLIYLGSGYKEKGCLDLSKAGELGSAEAYEIINNYCK